MSIETLAKQGREKVHTGLAGIETSKLRMLRNEQLKQCFNHFDETQYRMEFVARVRGTEFINDAASRSVNATWYALESVEGNLIWIANCSDNNDANYTNLANIVGHKVKLLICVGSNSQKLHQAFASAPTSVVDVSTIEEAVRLAFRVNIENTKVIFSPSCENGVPIDQESQRFIMEVNEL